MYFPNREINIHSFIQPFNLSHSENCRNDSIVDNLKINSESTSFRMITRPVKLSNFNSESGRSYHALVDDLTEITTAEIITDVSEQPPSNPNNMKYPNKYASPMNQDFSQSLLVFPNFFCNNAIKFNRLVIEKAKFNKICDKESFGKGKCHIPLIDIESSHLHRKNRIGLPGNLDKPYLKYMMNDSEKIIDRLCNVLLNPEDLIDNFWIRNNKKCNSSSKAETVIKDSNNKDFILQNLLKVEFTEAFTENNSNEPSMHASFSSKSLSELDSSNDPIQVTNQDSCIIEKNGKKTLNLDDSQMSESFVHHGYMLDPEIHKTSLTNQIQVEVGNVKTETENKNEEVLSYYSANDSIKPQEFRVPLTIEKVLILPPDLLENIKVSNENDIKKFISMKSVDVSLLDDFGSIILNDYITKKENSEIESVKHLEMNDYEGSFEDKLRSESTFKENVKDKVEISLKEIDNKIYEMEKISVILDKKFSKSKNCFQQQSNKQNKTEDIDKKKNLKSNVEAEYDITSNTGDSSKYFANDSEMLENKVSCSHSFIKFSNLEIIENDNNKDAIFKDTERSTNFSTKKSYSFKSPEIGNKCRDEREKNIFINRLRSARRIAMETIKTIGLPTKCSDKIPIKINYKPSSNEMMLNELQKEHHNNSIKDRYVQNRSFNTHKPIRHVSFTNKVRLQRPEITRKKIMAHRSYYQKLNIIRSTKLQPGETDLSSRSMASQNTDINSELTDWSIPDNVKRILNENSLSDGQLSNKDFSQDQSLNSNSVIDWDEISKILLRHGI